MQSVSLAFICGLAFLVVFAILALLALTMRIIMFVFPSRKAETDTALISAIAAASRAAFPGTIITHIEERK